ncbi:MAG: glycosyltransferase family 4 protein [Planctomycetes bacterium]|nr:glycosyltransferase family 4 protein [Planctomycetota bacterium]
MKIAYVMSRFPKITETFILLEILELCRRGVCPEVYPLIRQKEPVAHTEVGQVMSWVHYTPFLSAAVLLTNLWYLLSHPRRYLGSLWEMIAGSFGSWGLLVKTLILFPKSVRIAHDVRRRGITHVHAHFATFPAATALVIHRLTGVPFSFTAHGSDIHVVQRMLAQKIRASRFAVMISDYNRRFVLERCGRALADKLVTIHCGIRPEDYQPGRAPSPAQGGFSILCVASFGEVKGHTYLIDACRALRERGVDFTCHLVGDGPLRQAITNQITATGLTDHFVLHGALPRQKVAQLLKEADAAVLTSVLTERGDREGIPVALMEAMAAGLPVVASDISGIPELVTHEETGLLAPPRDSRAIADALERLSADPDLRRRLGSNGRRKVLQDFNITSSVSQLIELWGETQDY